MINPRWMCRKHLLGEHVEIHMTVGSLRKKKNLAGFLSRGLLELQSIERRHDQLVREMQRRGYTHASPLPRFKAVTGPRVDRSKSLVDLTARCADCRALAATR